MGGQGRGGGRGGHKPPDPNLPGPSMPIVDKTHLPSAYGGSGNKPQHTYTNRDKEVRNECARKLILSSSEVELCKLAPWLLKRTVNSAIGGHPELVRKLIRSKELLVITKSAQQTKKLLSIKKLHSWNVTVRTPYNLNTVRGVISYPGFNYISDEEIVKEMADLNVIACKHFNWKNRTTGLSEPSNTVTLTFKQERLPEEVEVGYEKVRVRMYIPPPLRCYNCFRFGHVSDSCEYPQTCSNCAEREHTRDDCGNTEKCVNCSGNHHAFDKECEVLQKEKKIMELKCRSNISNPEARKQIERKTYAQIAKSGTPISTPARTCKCACTCEQKTQVEVQENAVQDGLMESGQDQAIALNPEQTIPDELERTLTGQTNDFDVRISPPIIGGTRARSNDSTLGQVNPKKLKKETWR